MLKRYLGDKAFYRHILGIVLPIIVQNGITNFVSLLDNIMIGQVGTVQMSGVAIANQLMTIFNLCLFGGISGAGIYGAQFFGQRNDEGVRHTFRIKVWISIVLILVFCSVFLIGGRDLISLFLSDGGDNVGDIGLTLDYGQKYLNVMLIGTIPFVGYVFDLAEDADVEAFMTTLQENANMRWNICTEAEQTVIASYGDKVFFLMCPKSLEG